MFQRKYGIGALIVELLAVVTVLLLVLLGTAFGQQRGIAPLKEDAPCRVEVTSLTPLEQATVKEALMQAAFIIREPADLVSPVPYLDTDDVQEQIERQRKVAQTIRQAAAIMGVEVKK
jgi:hypothetical protein